MLGICTVVGLTQLFGRLQGRLRVRGRMGLVLFYGRLRVVVRFGMTMR